MGLLDPWRQTRAAILAAPPIQQAAWVNPNYRAAYPPLNRDVIEAVQSAGTAAPPRTAYKAMPFDSSPSGSGPGGDQDPLPVDIDQALGYSEPKGFNPLGLIDARQVALDPIARSLTNLAPMLDTLGDNGIDNSSPVGDDEMSTDDDQGFGMGDPGGGTNGIDGADGDDNDSTDDDAGGGMGDAGDPSGGGEGDADGGDSGDPDGAGGTFAKGGFVPRKALTGPNPKGPDDGRAYLDAGEFVIRKSAVKKYGRGLLEQINDHKISPKKLKGLLG